MASGSGSEYDYLVICVVLFSMSCYLKCYVFIKNELYAWNCLISSVSEFGVIQELHKPITKVIQQIQGFSEHNAGRISMTELNFEQNRLQYLQAVSVGRIFAS